MTLAEWCRMSGIALATMPLGVVGTAIIMTFEEQKAFPDTYSQLWRLSDYKVSTVSGPVVWLVPVKE